MASERIIGLQFGIRSPKSIVEDSAVEIVTDKTYNGAVPEPGGLFDPRMGVIENNKKCLTCRQTAINCPGHCGHIRLAVPVFLVHFMPYIHKVLKCVCLKCSRLLVDADSAAVANIHDRQHNKILDALVEMITHEQSAARHCGDRNRDGCGALQAKILWEKKDKDEGGYYKLEAVYKATEGAEEQRELLTAAYVQRLFERISPEDIRAMGFNPALSHPSWMVTDVLSVAPLASRPSVDSGGSKKAEDDITQQYIAINKVNLKLRALIDEGSKERADAIASSIRSLQWAVGALFDNNIAGIPQAAQRDGRPLKTLKDRLIGKHGRVRGNLMGKRVDHSARSVITPNPNLKVNEVGVPLVVALGMSVPERVTPYNRARLQKAVDNGPAVWPGARSVHLAADGRNMNLKFVPAGKLQLRDGDVVHRHLMDGDPVLMNRQPSLHRMSMMTHFVVVFKDTLSFMLNPSACKPYNADGIMH
jgi:DNA-directed RNA polymerase II subunit RPB1